MTLELGQRAESQRNPGPVDLEVARVGARHREPAQAAVVGTVGSVEPPAVRRGVRRVEGDFRRLVDGRQPDLHGRVPTIEPTLHSREGGLDLLGLVLGHVVAHCDAMKGYPRYRDLNGTSRTGRSSSVGTGIGEGFSLRYLKVASAFQNARRRLQRRVPSGSAGVAGGPSVTLHGWNAFVTPRSAGVSSG